VTDGAVNDPFVYCVPSSVNALPLVNNRKFPAGKQEFKGARSGAMNNDRILELCAVIRETSLCAHRYLRHGHLEKIYENSLANRLSNAA